MELPNACLCCLFLSILGGLTIGLEIISSGPTSIEKASGESVKLEFMFSLGPEDSGPLDIEWSLLSSDNQKEDKVVILYSGDRSYEDYYAPLKGRVHFNSPDPKNGDASINLSGLKSSDSGTYQCKVKKAPGIRSRKMLLIVMVKPSKPRCYAEGLTQEGKDIVLRCTSNEGTKPVQYSWEKTSNGKVLPASGVIDPVGGTINVRNASASASGTYRCTATNRVGTEDCILYLNVTPPRQLMQKWRMYQKKMGRNITQSMMNHLQNKKKSLKLKERLSFQKNGRITWSSAAYNQQGRHAEQNVQELLRNLMIRLLQPLPQ